ncbi:hypothetical protein SO802_008526 [Lithocarpus litseifolius]|uniref:Rx N-terminal domain-containing protein n=1 Tax=Lithocarpus litseifolius TaxID=425828 RepID=A0AAW2DAA5_9ROSI
MMKCGRSRWSRRICWWHLLRWSIILRSGTTFMDEGSVPELKKHERIVLELWLEELQDAVFNTEDIVFKIHTEALRDKLDGQICESEKMENIRCSLESYVKQGKIC